MTHRAQSVPLEFSASSAFGCWNWSATSVQTKRNVSWLKHQSFLELTVTGCGNGYLHSRRIMGIVVLSRPRTSSYGSTIRNRYNQPNQKHLWCHSICGDPWQIAGSINYVLLCSPKSCQGWSCQGCLSVLWDQSRSRTRATQNSDVQLPSPVVPYVRYSSSNIWCVPQFVAAQLEPRGRSAQLSPPS